VNELAQTVSNILEQLQTRGEEALRSLSERLDGYSGPWKLSEEEKQVLREENPICEHDRQLFERVIARLQRYHERQKPRDDLYLEGDSLLGMVYRPVQRIGVYVPGGKPLPSTLLMVAIPALIAGVEQIAVCTPPWNGSLHPVMLYLADRLGISEIYRLGGAQAIGAMAYGIGMQKVDKIFGPGNRFVNEAKRQVFGVVGIDSLAGPSEICVIADESAPEEYVRNDLLSQREHGEDSRAWLLTDCPRLASALECETSIEVCLLPDLDSCVQKANNIAPEHLEIITANPYTLLPGIRNAGAIYLGPNTPVPAADYFLGSNHVLPTGGTARSGSMLGVVDFLKRSALASLSNAELLKERELGMRMATIEGLEFHRRALEVRKEE